MWNSQPVSFETVSGPMEFDRELRLAFPFWESGGCLLWMNYRLLACLATHISSEAMAHLASSSLPWKSCSFL